jgi:hypothetical protein
MNIRQQNTLRAALSTLERQSQHQNQRRYRMADRIVIIALMLFIFAAYTIVSDDPSDQYHPPGATAIEARR